MKWAKFVPPCAHEDRKFRGREKVEEERGN